MRKSSLQWPQVHAFRMGRHHFTTLANLDEICHNVCGIQAQMMSAARIALWARMRDLKNEEIQTALWKKRSLVRTSVMRQTLHLLAAADFPIYVTALRRSRLAALWRGMSKFGIVQKEADALNQAVLDALTEGPLPQRELMRLVEPGLAKSVRAWMERFWNIFRLANVEGLICYGPERGAQITFVRTDRWLPKQKRISEHEAQQQMLRRYLHAYGPAALQDFAKWTGFSMPEAKTVWTRFRGEMLEVDVEGQKRWILREDGKALQDCRPGDSVLRLAPSFDPYLLGHASKNHLVDPAHYKRVFRNQGWISPVVLLDGRVAGIWSSQRAGKRLLIEIEPIEKLTKKTRSLLEQEAESLGKFLELSAEISYQP
ncbi:MAG TPA: winged helix DNA-binding domain-containing protein [Bryobacteraceae bacterium]|nr:winged helix DNA-binding domain-containing protein [Bryobacteraceae bacterium]